MKQSKMAFTHQPLLDTIRKTSISCKIFLLVFAIFAIISSFFVVPRLIKLNNDDLSDHEYMCRGAFNQETCQDFVSEVVSGGVMSPVDGSTILQNFLGKYVHHMDHAILKIRSLGSRINSKNEQRALADCLELMDLSINLVLDSIVAVSKRSHTNNADAKAWLSGVLTNHVTCLDGLQEKGKSPINAVIEDLISRASASLAMLGSMSKHTSNYISDFDKEMMLPLRGKFPSWIRHRDRKLLQSTAKDVKADLVVAKDGSGNYTTVADAVAAAPDKNKTRYVIHVKKGTYEENVEVGKNKKNLMIIGDGMNSTIITGSLNVVDGSTTFRSATLAAVGEGFILQDICIQNTAGPEKHQAVALRVGADKSIINRCLIDAYQDTLYTHSLRQFYRDSNITGTVDFIFGNAAVVFQKCNLIARKPMKNQKNMVTAQGRTDPNQITGTSVQDCEVIPSEDLKPVLDSFKTYLGRPWKNYSRTVYMQSYIDDHIDPAGWAEWDGDFALKTLYYGEYMNYGPGAGTSERVKWPGYHVITDAAEAMNFTVKELIQGGEWLSSTGVAFTEGL